jgi:organic hydroperoxide reductase OsmC/OhrA
VFSDKQLRFEKIIHRPHVTVAADADDGEWEMILRATEQAEKSCMISRALRGNVELEVKPFLVRENVSG